MKPPIKYALIALAITFVWIIIEHLAGWNTTRHDIGQYTRMLPMILFWVLIFVAVNESRGQRTTYKFNEGLRDGMLMSLIFCAGFTIMILIYQKFVNPEFFETLRAYTISEMKSKSLSQAEIDKAMRDMDMSFNGSAISFFLLFVFSFGWGLIVSAVAARVYRIRSRISQ
jgi:hypothetical protein